ncbi:MAG TPA: hypothetical protein PKN80_07975 [bacterium]|nr:hypothetical protein [bacterium]
MVEIKRNKRPVLVWMNLAEDFQEDPARVPEVVRRLAGAGVTDLCPFAYPPGGRVVYQRSRLMHRARQVDLLGPLVETAHRLGVRVHYVLLPFTHLGEVSLAGLPDPVLVPYLNDQFEKKEYYCVSDPASLVRCLAVLDEVRRDYGVDGFQLDSIRDRGAVLVCQCPRCWKRVEDFYGGRVAPPEEMAGHKSFRVWYAASRKEYVTALVRAVHETAAGLGAEVNMAARSWSGGGAFAEGQDWPDWVLLGLMEMVAPMTYHPADFETFTVEVERQLRLAPAGFQNLWPAIGINPGRGSMTGAMFRRQLDWLVERGVSGLSIFQASGLSDELLAILADRTG